MGKKKELHRAFRHQLTIFTADLQCAKVFVSFHGANRLTSCNLQKAALRKAHVGDSRSYPLVNQDSCEKSPSSKTWNDRRTQWPICTSSIGKSSINLGKLSYFTNLN